MGSKIKYNYIKIGTALLLGIYLWNCIQNPNSYHLISGVDLVIHEAGHFIFIFFGNFMHILGGSLTEILIPLIFSVYFFLRRDNYSGGMILMWVGECIANVARYASDAITMQLPLLGGDNVIHDWNYILSAMHLLKYTPTISTCMNGIALFIFITGITVALFSVIGLKQKVNGRWLDYNQT